VRSHEIAASACGQIGLERRASRRPMPSPPPTSDRSLAGTVAAHRSVNAPSPSIAPVPSLNGPVSVSSRNRLHDKQVGGDIVAYNCKSNVHPCSVTDDASTQAARVASDPCTVHTNPMSPVDRFVNFSRSDRLFRPPTTSSHHSYEKYDCYRTPLLFIFYKTLEGESLGWGERIRDRRDKSIRRRITPTERGVFYRVSPIRRPSTTG